MVSEQQVTRPGVPADYQPMKNNYPISPAPLDRVTHRPSLDDELKLADALAKSRSFKGVNEMYGALAKIVIGREYGLGPGAALMQLSIVEGKPTFEYPALLGFLRSSGRYEYDLSFEGEGDAFAAVCTVWRIDPKTGELKSPKVERYSVADAKRAKLWDKNGRDGTPNTGVWRLFTRNMCAGRAVANAVRFHAPDAIHGIPTYTTGELDDAEPISVEARVIDTPPVPAPQQTMTALVRGPDGCKPVSVPLAPSSAETRPVAQDSLPPEGGEAGPAGTVPTATAPASPPATAPAPSARVLAEDLLTAIGALGDEVEASRDLANRIHQQLEDISGGVETLAWAHWTGVGVTKGKPPTGRQLRALVRNLETTQTANPQATVKRPRARKAKADAAGTDVKTDPLKQALEESVAKGKAAAMEEAK